MTHRNHGEELNKSASGISVTYNSNHISSSALCVFYRSVPRHSCSSILLQGSRFRITGYTHVGFLMAHIHKYDPLDRDLLPSDAANFKLV